MKKIVLILVSGILFFSCDKDQLELIDRSINSESFIQVYYEPEQVMLMSSSLIETGVNIPVVTPNNPNLILKFTGKDILRGRDEASFKKHSTYFGDLGYNHKVMPASNQALCETFSKISIYSDRDFNERYPAGTSLDQIILFDAESALKFIRSGYQKEVSRYIPFQKKLADLTTEDLTLMSCKIAFNECLENPSATSGSIHFTTLPIESGLHRLTIRIETTDGKVLQTEQSILFQ